ncbi:MAG: DUF2027 domain-containing protein [Candidatus Amulumruptor caecigallinarius]|nr:DUF2027 domain-containing protein [Candidatus Amulumruptor caecigallinarius]
MVKPGDTVRYLNATGGGVVVRVEGKIAYVDDDGFETPVQTNEVVVVLPAGHRPDRPGNIMFDQKAYDTGRTDIREKIVEAPEKTQPKPMPPTEDDFPIEETEYGDDITLMLAFEPENVKQLSGTPINAALVNDSNYFVRYTLLRRADAGSGWMLEASGEAAPNELVDLRCYTQESVKALERIVFQAIAYKKGKLFEEKDPINVSRKIDMTKFYKLHCFHPGVYFETPVLEVPLYAEKVRNAKKSESKKGAKR